MAKTKKRHAPEFKLKVVLEILKPTFRTLSGTQERFFTFFENMLEKLVVRIN